MAVLLSPLGLGQSISPGVKFGVNYAILVGADVRNPSTQSITTFNSGVYATFHVGSLFDIQPEVIYTRKGCKASADEMLFFGLNLHVEETATISYLEIPVLLKLNIPFLSTSLVRPTVFIGPSAAFVLKSKVEVEINGEVAPEQELSNLKSSDFGVILGVGVDFNVLSGIIVTLDARYDLGLQSINTSNNPKDIKNKVMTINAGIGF